MNETTARNAFHDYDTARLQTRYPHPQRILTAIRLAKDPDTCRALLNGDPINPAHLDQYELRKAQQRRLVRLDLTAIDQLTAA